ncbi:MAG TPA: hypothetical protein VMA72_04675 [Streptosporangiaceae bacterium]|nr:hypothetical protein [Streptosporangiaceae bacterium]
MSHAAHVRVRVAEPETSEAVTWLRSNWVPLAAVVMIGAQLYLVATVLSHAYFRQDDFVLFDWALKSRFDWHFLGTNYGGHFMPGSLALAWVLDRVSLYDWTLASIVNLAILAASCLALLRLLRTMFGKRPAILIPLAVYLFSPIMLPGLTFWATTLQWLPAQLAILMALNAHISYVRTGRYWHAVAAAIWIAFGLLFDEVNVLVPVLLLALTSAFLLPGGWPHTLAESLRRFWRAWLLYLALVAAYALVFVHQLHTSSQQPVKPGQFSNVLAFISELIRVSFVPGALGGPWHWLALSSGSGTPADYAFATEYPPLTQLSWSVAAFIILASLWYRRHAWRGWVILAAWIFGSAVVPLVAGRVGLGVSPGILGDDLHYLADSMPVLAVCLGLAFWPLAGEQNAYQAKPARWVPRTGAVAVLAIFLAGSLWSYDTYEHATSTVDGKSYIATARAAVAAAPKDAEIVATPVPPFVETYVWFGRYAYTDKVIGALGTAAQGLHWTDAPAGVFSNLMVFDGVGRLWRSVAIQGDTVHAPAGRGCWQVGSRGTKIPLGGALYHWGWEISMSYVGPAATMAVQFGGVWHDVQLPAGLHTAWVPAAGAGSVVRAKLVSGGPTECVSSLSIGNVVPSVFSHPSPAKPIPG